MTTQSASSTQEVAWITPVSPSQGVDTIGYVNGARTPVGLNGILVGQFVIVNDAEGVYKHKYGALKRRRLSNELDHTERRKGMRMGQWKDGPWRVTFATVDGSFGITQDIQAEFGQFDMMVRADMVSPWEKKHPSHI